MLAPSAKSLKLWSFNKLQTTKGLVTCKAHIVLFRAYFIVEMKRPIKYMVEIFVRARARTCAQGLRQKKYDGWTH